MTLDTCVPIGIFPDHEARMFIIVSRAWGIVAIGIRAIRLEACQEILNRRMARCWGFLRHRATSEPFQRLTTICLNVTLDIWGVLNIKLLPEGSSGFQSV